MQTILVCYEERPVATRVLDRAAELAKALDAKIVVASVAHAMGLVPHSTGPYDPVDPLEHHEQELTDAREYLGKLGVTTVETAMGVGDPARTIVELAEERGVDLIVLGAHDGGAVSRIFEGSVGDTVAHHASTDVMIVH
jgi:nucleotide-binding universal stress UspA family protein